jgi:hypothetical protein
MRDHMTSTPYSSIVGSNAKVYFFPRPDGDPTSVSGSTISAC